MKTMKTAIWFIALFLPLGTGALLSGCASQDHREHGGGYHESTGAYVDDATITTKVKSAILGDPDLHVTQINVETYEGVVQLSGFVDNHSQIKQAETDARKIDGVKSVKNDLRVR